MKYADIVKQGITDDTPPGFSSSPKSNQNQNAKAKTQNTKPAQNQNAKPKTSQNAKQPHEQVKKIEKKEPKTSEDTFMWNEEETTSDDSFNDQSHSESDGDDPKVYGTAGGKKYVKKGTDITALKKKEAEKKEAERKKDSQYKNNNQKRNKGGNQYHQSDQNQTEWANIKQLMLRDYHSSLKHLDAIIKDMNFEIVNSVHSRENELKDYLKKLQQPKTEKSVWQGGERKQDNKPDSKGPRDNEGKGQFQKGKGEGNQGQFQKGQGKGEGNQGQFQQKGKKGKKKAENAKVTVNAKDKDGFLTQRTITQEENAVYKKTGVLPELKVEPVVAVVETKKPVKKQINTAQVIANNPFSAVLLAGSYDAPEVDIAKNQQRKAQAAKKNKAKQQKLGEVQNQQIKQLEKQTSQQQAAGKKNTGKNNKKKGAVQFVNKPAPKQKQQPQQKKAQDKPKPKESQEAVNKKQIAKKQQAEAEKKRQEKEEQRILANQRDIEKENEKFMSYLMVFRLFLQQHLIVQQVFLQAYLDWVHLLEQVVVLSQRVSLAQLVLLSYIL
jgi:hypothetical protein